MPATAPRKARQPRSVIARVDGGRTALVAAVLTGMLLLVLLTTTGITGSIFRHSGPRPGMPPAANVGPVEEPDHRLGAIISETWDSDGCTVQAFDNYTGRIFGIGYVECEKVFPRDKEREKKKQVARFKSIRSGFQR